MCPYRVKIYDPMKRSNFFKCIMLWCNGKEQEETEIDDNNMKVRIQRSEEGHGKSYTII